MNINQIKQSNFLKKEDVGQGVLATIKGDVFQENVAMEGAPHEMKYCLAFVELEKPLVLNSINAQLIAKITGSEETDRWNGHKVVLYTDPSVSFGGKLVGGIRVRAPRGAAAKPAPAQQATSGINNPTLRAVASAPRTVAASPSTGPVPFEEPEPPVQEEDDVPF